MRARESVLQYAKFASVDEGALVVSLRRDSDHLRRAVWAEASRYVKPWEKSIRGEAQGKQIVGEEGRRRAPRCVRVRRDEESIV